jgi:hypothetical protein
MKRTYKIKSISPDMSTPRQTTKPPSLVTPGGDCSAKETMQYTGSEMLGIAIIHKSCLQPVFSKQAATDTANMRR